VLAERMLLAALHGPPRDVSAERGANADGVGARALGAVLALVRIRSLPVSQAIAQRTSGRLLPLTQSQAGREAAAIAARLKADHFLASALENAAGSVGGSRTSSDE
jgi:hypothetical protein